MKRVNSNLSKILERLNKAGKIESVSESKSKEVFEQINKELEPLNFESKLKQSASEKKAGDIFINT